MGQDDAISGAGSGIALRAVRSEDIDFAWTLYRDLMKPLTEELLDWREDRQRQGIEADLARDGAAIIEFDCAQAGWLMVGETEREIVIHQIYLLPTFQNRGIGSGLIWSLMVPASAADRGIALNVMKNNRARALYERLGFAVTGGNDHKLHLELRSNRA